MYLLDIIRRSGRSLLSAKARTLLTALAIAVGAFALTLTMAATNGARNYANLLISSNFDPTELIVANDASLFNGNDASSPQVYDPSFGSITSDRGASHQVRMLSDGDLSRISSTSGISQVQPSLSVNLQYVTRDGMRKYVANATAYSAYQKPQLLAGSIPANIPANGVILPEGFLSSLGFTSPQAAVGQTIRVSVQKAVDTQALISALQSGNTSSAAPQSQESNFTVLAVTQKPSTLIQQSAALNLQFSSAALNNLNDFITAGSANYHKYLTATAKVANGTDKKQLQTVENRLQGLGYTVQSVVDTQKTLTQVTSVLQSIVSVFGLIAVIASVFGVVNTMYISVLQRTREIGLMKALGMHKRDIKNLFRFEAALIGFIGGTIGSLLAIALGVSLNPWITRKLNLGHEHLLAFNPGEVIILILLLTLIAMLAGLLPARKAAKLDPIAALRTE